MKHKITLCGVIAGLDYCARKSEPRRTGLVRFARNDVMLPLALIAAITALAGCSDNRKAPTVIGEPSYSHTLLLFDRQVAAGQELSSTFALRDTVEDGLLTLTGFLKPEEGLTRFITLGNELDSLSTRILDLSGQILTLQLKPSRTPAEEAALDSLIGLRSAANDQVSFRNLLRDSLDTRLDDRFKISFWLDADTVELYPRAEFLDSTAVPTHLHSGETVVWGQGFYLAQEDAAHWRGKTMQLSLKKIWVADGSYQNPIKPARPSNPDQLPELLPISDWLTRLTPGNHTLHVRFGSAGTTTEATATLYVIYKTAG